MHRLDGNIEAGGDQGETGLERLQTASTAGAFGKYDQVAPVREGSACFANQIRTGFIGNKAAEMRNRAEQKVSLERFLDDAYTVGNKAQQVERIHQGGVVGDHNSTSDLIESLRVHEFKTDPAAYGQIVHPEPEQPPKHSPSPTSN